MLVSGELDKAILAFDIAAGQAAMGVQVNMWFILYGVNAIKSPPGLFSWKNYSDLQDPLARAETHIRIPGCRKYCLP